MSGEYAQNYLAVAIAAAVSVVFVLVSFLLSRLLAPRKPSAVKASPYECGMPPIGRFWAQVHIRYYLFAILFLIFDVEAAFLFPWALVFSQGSALVFYEMVLFVAILFFGLVYAWKKGVLQWR